MRSSVSKSFIASQPGHPPTKGKAPKVRRELSLSDLPADEKEKIARLAQRLIALGREHEQVKASSVEVEKQCEQLREDHHRLQEENTESSKRIHTCYGLIRLYQDKLADMVALLEEKERERAALQTKCAQCEQEIARQSELIASQRSSLESLKSQSSSEAALNAGLVKKLEAEKKAVMATVIQKDETLVTQRKKIAFLESSLALKESAIVNLETSVMRLQGEVDFRAKQQETERSTMQEILQKTVSELDAIKATHLLKVLPKKSEIHVNEREQSDEIPGMDVDVPWDSNPSRNDCDIPAAKIYPLRKPAVLKKQRRRRSSTPAVVAECDAAAEESEIETRPIVDSEGTRPRTSKTSDVRVSQPTAEGITRRKENLVNSAAGKEAGSGIECKSFDVYDGRLFKLLGEIDAVGGHDR